MSHVAAVLPLASGRLGTWFVPSALVIGAMAPDWPYFFPPFTGSRWTHAAYGPVSIDLVIGLAVFGLWLVMLRRPAVDLAPDWLLLKLPDDPGRVSLSLWMRAAVSVVVGAATHCVWDTFTHPDRWGTRQFASLNEIVAGLPGYKWLQYGSGMLGLVVLVAWLALRPPLAPTHPPARRWGRAARRLTWCAVVASTLLVALVSWLVGVHRNDVWLAETMVVQAVRHTITAGSVATLVVCASWWIHQGWNRQDLRSQRAAVRLDRS